MSQMGIKQLLEAEQKAQDLVNKARKEKVQLLKQARDEAEKEVLDYRQKRQVEFEEFSKKFLSGTDTYKAQLQTNTEVQIKKINEDVDKHADVVATMLVKYVEQVYTGNDL